ncbi:NAD(P)-binding protein, partial [Lentithecium fluviatile CBS 122367]
MKRLFFLGATGHIGGATLNAIQAQFPDVAITALVRDQNKAQRLSKRFANLEAIVGDFQNLDLIESVSQAADIVINLLHGSHAAIEAAIRGLASRPEKGFYIQTSGAFLVSEGTSGATASEKIWSDIVDINLITTMPPARYHQRTDQLVRDKSGRVNVAIVSPTVVYGLSDSTENQVPITIRDIVATTKEISAGFTLAQGKNILGYVHVHDLADIYVRLFADAVKGARRSDQRLWGPHAYYFANGEELSFAAYMEALVKVLQDKKILFTDVVKEIGAANDVTDWECVGKTAMVHGYGANVRCRSERAQTLLGWKAQGSTLIETLPETVDALCYVA